TEALAVLDDALGLQEKNDDRWLQPETLRLKALAQRALGMKPSEVEPTLTAARAMAERLGTALWLERIKAAAGGRSAAVRV
ncbi:MAG: hypothetical protein ACT4PL_01535, partial [Phycisphaerales bacterium]